MSRYVLGIDTSNYCTSLCLLSDAGEIMADKRKWLPVARGMKGVRQSDGVFHHVRQLADLWCSVTVPDCARLAAVCASSAPRPVEGSYMPVFTVGVNWGRSLAHAAGVPFYETTHQEGHIAAALGAADREVEEDVLTVLHLSGGTSDMLHVRRLASGFQIRKVGGSTDLYAGQLVDRIGVALGLSFPAGRELEQLARESQQLLSVPASVQGTHFSFSGPETALKRLLETGRHRVADIARAVENVIAKTVEKSLLNAFKAGFPKHVLLVGGVAANNYIRERLRRRLEHRAVGARISFARVHFSGDNAFGVASIGWDQLKKELDR
jgi:N6-L-threonylcarbamoyladenine synthase